MCAPVPACAALWAVRVLQRGIRMRRGEKLTALLIALLAPRVSSGRTPARTAAPVQGRGESPRVPWGTLPGGMLTRPRGRLSTPRVPSEGGQC